MNHTMALATVQSVGHTTDSEWLLVAFPLLLLGQGEGTFAQWARPIGWGFAWWGTVLYWIAGVMYIIQARQVARAHAGLAT